MTFAGYDDAGAAPQAGPHSLPARTAFGPVINFEPVGVGVDDVGAAHRERDVVVTEAQAAHRDLVVGRQRRMDPHHARGHVGSSPSRPRSAASEAPAAHAWGRHAAGYGIGSPTSSRARPLISSGSSPCRADPSAVSPPASVTTADDAP